MINFKLSNNFEYRFKKFLSSNLFHNQLDAAKSSYWEYHSKEIKYSIKNSILSLEGKSGYYIPHKKNSYVYFLKLIKIFVKKIFGSQRSTFLTFEKAFDQVMNDKKNFNIENIKFNEKKILARNIFDCRKQFPFNFEINEHIIRSYYYTNILNSHIDLSKTNFIAEIGAGSGNLMLLLKHHFNTKCIINIDLPETLILCIPFLNNIFPEAKILFPNEINRKINKDTLLNYDFIFLAPNQIDLLENGLIDLFINTASFGEMTMSQIANYINFIQKVGKQDSFFFNSNRAEKIPISDKNDENSKHVDPIKFSEYPFFDNEVIFFETCKFTNLVQKDPCYLRLEKLKK